VVSGLHSVAVALLFFLLGYLIVDFVLGRRDVDPVVRVGLALPAVLAAALVFMLAHIASGGRLFANAGVVRMITVLGIVILAYSSVVRRRRYRGRVSWLALGALVAIVIVAVFIWGRAVFALLPAGTSGDTNLHVGWAASLLNGERLPTNALTGEIPNYYPWLFHSALAWLSALTPGGRTWHALGPMQLIQVGGAAASLFALGYVLWRKWAAGLCTALLGALSGGFGFLSQNPGLINNVRGEHSEVGLTFGDLMFRRSYNFAFHNLVPVHPREVTYTLLPALVILFVLAMRTEERIYLIAAGLLLGIIGLTGGEAFFAGALMCIAFVGISGKRRRVRAAIYMGVPATVTYSLWLVPLVFNYLKYGGFVDTASAPVTLTPLQVLGGWGVMTPLALLGAVLLTIRVRRDQGALIVLTMAAAAGALLLAAVFGGSVLASGFDTLGRAHRYWPIVFLALAICAGFGLFRLLERVARWHLAPAVVVFGAICVFALASPWIGTRDVEDPDQPGLSPKDPSLTAALQGDETAWMAVISPVPGRHCTVAVPEKLMVHSYAYTGYRHVIYGWAKPGNTARVRWKEIYSYIPTDAQRRRDNDILVHAVGSWQSYREVLDRYGVDRVLVFAELAESPALAGYKMEPARRRDGEFVVVHTGPCSAP
jgi:hypothetical protein